jgi:hypothetical protein
MQKLIVRTALITLAGVIVLTGVVSLFIGIFSPLTFARMFEDLGGHKTSMFFYVKNYERDNNINNLHMVVDKAITFKFNEDIIKYYELLEAEEDYYAFISFLDYENVKAATTVLEKALFFNEDNRLKNRYIEALAKVGRFDDAFEFAANNLFSPQFNDPLLFVFTGLIDFVNDDNFGLFNEIKMDPYTHEPNRTVAGQILAKYNMVVHHYELNEGAHPAVINAVLVQRLMEMNRFLYVLSDNVEETLPGKSVLNDEFDTWLNKFLPYTSGVIIP